MISEKVFAELEAAGLGGLVACIAGDGSFREEGLEEADAAAIKGVIAAHLARRTPLALTVESKRAEVNAERDRRYFGILAVDGVRYDADEKSRTKITGRAAMAAAGLAPSAFVWMDADNIPRSHTPASFLALCAGLDELSQALHAAAWAKKGQLDALTAVEDALAFDPSQDWPA